MQKKRGGNILGTSFPPKTGASMIMSENLITSDHSPGKFTHRGNTPASRHPPHIPLNQIERLECWKHQIWVKIKESRAKLLVIAVCHCGLKKALR
jgi:hypothetical protein